MLHGYSPLAAAGALTTAHTIIETTKGTVVLAGAKATFDPPAIGYQVGPDGYTKVLDIFSRDGSIGMTTDRTEVWHWNGSEWVDPVNLFALMSPVWGGGVSPAGAFTTENGNMIADDGSRLIIAERYSWGGTDYWGIYVFVRNVSTHVWAQEAKLGAGQGYTDGVSAGCGLSGDGSVITHSGAKTGGWFYSSRVTRTGTTWAYVYTAGAEPGQAAQYLRGPMWNSTDGSIVFCGDAYNRIDVLSWAGSAYTRTAAITVGWDSWTYGPKILPDAECTSFWSVYANGGYAMARWTNIAGTWTRDITTPIASRTYVTANYVALAKSPDDSVLVWRNLEAKGRIYDKVAEGVYEMRGDFSSFGNPAPDASGYFKQDTTPTTHMHFYFLPEAKRLVASPAATFALTGHDASIEKTAPPTGNIDCSPWDFTVTGAPAYIEGFRLGPFTVAGLPATLKQQRIDAAPNTFGASGAGVGGVIGAPDYTYAPRDPGYPNFEQTTGGYIYTWITPDGTRIFVRDLPNSTTNYYPPVDVYVRSAGVWSLEDSIPDPVQEDTPGGSSAEWGRGQYAVSEDGAHLFIPAPFEHHQTTYQANGAVYYYSRTNGVWTFRQRIQPAEVNTSESSANFGYTSAMSADGLTAIVSAPFLYNGVNIGGGALFVLKRSGYVWTSTMVDYTGYGYSWFGYRHGISADGLTIAYNASKTGAVINEWRIKRFNGSSWVTLANFAGGNGFTNICVNEDGTAVLVGQELGFYMYTEVAGVWGMRHGTFSPYAMLEWDWVSFHASRDLKYIRYLSSGQRIVHLSSVTPKTHGYGIFYDTVPKTTVEELHPSAYSHALATVAGLTVISYQGATSGKRFLHWRERIPSAVIPCDTTQFERVGAPAMLCKGVNAAAQAFSVSGYPAGFISGVAFVQEFGVFAVAGEVAALVYQRSASVDAWAFSLSSPEAVFLRLKGAMDGEAAALVFVGTDAILARKFTQLAGNTVYSFAGYEARVARVFEMSLGAGEFSTSPADAQASIRAGMAAGTYASLVAPVGWEHFRMVPAEPGEFLISITPMRGVSPLRRGVSVGPYTVDKVALTTTTESIHVER